MTNGKILAGSIVLIAIIFGVGAYYAQVYGYYEDVVLDQVELTPNGASETEAVIATNIRAIDAESSPIRFRACFETTMSDAMLTEMYQVFEKAEPRNAPEWFDCFDAAQIGADLEAGNVTAFLGQRNFEFGIDRVVAIYPDGRGYIWHQINDCGDKLYDGSPADENCPKRERD